MPRPAKMTRSERAKSIVMRTPHPENFDFHHSSLRKLPIPWRWTRARAKKWFRALFPGFKIIAYDGKQRFDFVSANHWGRVFETQFSVQFGPFLFRDATNPPGNL